MYPWADEYVSGSRLTVMTSAWRSTAQYGAPSLPGTVPIPVAGRCHDTGRFSRRMASRASRSSALRSQKSLVDTSTPSKSRSIHI
jgi:hypothetical protein